MKATQDVAERFWRYVDTTAGPDACWPWTASTFRARRGYGKFQAGTSRATARVVYAHRFAWELTNGEAIPPGMFACHHCDNPVCCNPAHIFIGTPADNQWDMSRKGRHHLQKRTHCKHGHPWTSENTSYRYRPDGSFKMRVCLPCKRESGRRSRAAA